MINIVRNIKPSLISLTTATRCLNQPELTLLAETVLFAERNYSHKFRKCSNSDNVWSSKLYAAFAKQLGLIDENDIKDFKIGGLALMLSFDLAAHLDGMNPKGADDLTIQFNFQISISDLDEECQDAIRCAYGATIASLPFTLIPYPRKCIINYGLKQKAIKDFPMKCQKETKGRKAMTEVLNDVGSTLDYNSRCFTRMGYARRVKELSHLPEVEFISAKAAIDKMVSSVLHNVLQLGFGSINLY